jgi:hypothetical protein
MNMNGQVPAFRIADIGEKQIVQPELVNRLTEKTSTLELSAHCCHLELL